MINNLNRSSYAYINIMKAQQIDIEKDTEKVLIVQGCKI